MAPLSFDRVAIDAISRPPHLSRRAAVRIRYAEAGFAADEFLNENRDLHIRMGYRGRASNA
jgi:hypothetical protein